MNRVQVVLSGFSVRLFCFVQTKTLCRYGCMYFFAALLLLLFAFQSMFISIWVSHLEIAEFPVSVRRYQCSRGSRANKEMLDIMRRRAAVGTDVEVCILLDSALVRAQESTISRS